MEIVLGALGILGCFAMMAVGMALMPRAGRALRRNPRLRSLVERLRRQSAIDRVLSWAEDERPSLDRATAPDGTVTVLFTDIENSTALNERLGDERWLEVLRAHNAVVRDCVREHGGYEVKSQGDGFMIAYPSVLEGLRCAVDMERHLAEAEIGEPLRVRIGLHTGEAIREGDDLYGRSVTLAARLGARAEGGQILTSAIVRDLAAGSGAFAFEEIGEVELKGIRSPQRVFAVAWAQPA